MKERKNNDLKTENKEVYNQPLNKREWLEVRNKSYDAAVGSDGNHYRFLRQVPKNIPQISTAYV